jgi:hypothetical protein
MKVERIKAGMVWKIGRGKWGNMTKVFTIVNDDTTEMTKWVEDNSKGKKQVTIGYQQL